MRLLVLVLVGRAMLASEHTTAPLFSRAHCHWGRLTTQGNASHGDCLSRRLSEAHGGT